MTLCQQPRGSGGPLPQPHIPFEQSMWCRTGMQLPAWILASGLGGEAKTGFLWDAAGAKWGNKAELAAAPAAPSPFRGWFIPVDPHRAQCLWT